MQIIKHGSFTWINLERPTKQELETLERRYHLHPLIVEELSRPTFRARLENYENLLYLILHFPTYNLRDSNTGKEIDFIVGKNFLITAHYRKFAHFEALVTSCIEHPETRKTYLSRGIPLLVYQIINNLFGFTFEQLDKMDKKMSHVSSNIFKDIHGRKGHSNLVKELSELRREIIDFRRTIHPQEHVLMSFETDGMAFFGKEMKPYLRNLVGTHSKIQNTLENHKEVIDSLHHTNTSLLTTRTTEITKNLTIMAFITFPLTLLASVFGMNTIYIPIVGNPYDFWIVIGMMAAGVTGMLAYFKHKKWF